MVSPRPTVSVVRALLPVLLCFGWSVMFHTSSGFVVSPSRSIMRMTTTTTTTPLRDSACDSKDLPNFDLPEEKRREEEEEAKRMEERAARLRQEIRDMEAQLGDASTRRPQQTVAIQEQPSPVSSSPLSNKRILVAGANGRLGSMVCRYLLRTHPEIRELVAAVHVVSENSSTSRGYGRISYEVGAEDGIGSIGPAWSSAEERTASFTFNGDIMSNYNLQNLRIVECELLDPVQCSSICEGVDIVIWCATDFNGNTPRAVSGLNFAFLFRAVASPTKGRVEIEGLQNMLGALKTNLQDRKWRNRNNNSNNASDDDDKDDRKGPPNFVLVSMVPEAFENFETLFGEFNGLKRQGETMVQTDFPSLSHTILQLGKFDDNFVGEGLDIRISASEQDGGDPKDEEGINYKSRLINRRDAARAVVDSLLNEDLKDKTVQVYTAVR